MSRDITTESKPSLRFKDYVLWLRTPRSRWAVGLWWLWRTLGALTLAQPIWRVVVRSLGSHPRGEQLLFEPGGAYLLELLRREQTALTSALEGTVSWLLLLSTLSVAPIAFLLVSLDRNPKDLNEFAGAALRSMPRLLFLWLAALASIAIALALGALCSALAVTALPSDIAEPSRDVLALLCATPALFLFGYTRVVLAPAQVLIGRGYLLLPALVGAASAVARAPLRWFALWFCPNLLVLVLMLATLALPLLDVKSVELVLHQGVLALVCCLRAALWSAASAAMPQTSG